MPSKEKIEKAKEYFNFFNEGDYITKEMVRSKEKIFEYIEELESDNYEQNNIINNYIDERRELIEKLEEKIKNNKARTDCTFCNNTCNSYAACKVCQEILEIVE